MSNDNYSAGAFEFDTSDFYESEAAINPTGDPFGAYILFWIDGSIQDLTPGFNYPDIHLWGNHNPADSTGWRFRLTDGGAQELVLQATVGDGVADQTASFGIIDGDHGGAIMRLIMASMWFDGTLLSLGINGALAATIDTGIGGGPIAAGANARLGLSLAGDEPAGALIKVVSCGFVNLPALASNDAGRVAGNAFAAAREAYDGDHIGPGSDWARRYDARSLITGTPATITKSSRGAAVLTAAVAPDTWPDVGNNQFSAAAAAAQGPAINLVRQGQGDDGISVTQFKNMDWLQGSSVFAPVASPS